MSVKSLINDPDFGKLSDQDKISALSSIDSDFKDLPPEQLSQVINGIQGGQSGKENTPSAMDRYNDSQLGSPAQLLQMIPDLASGIATKGSKIAEQKLNESGVNPTFSKIAAKVMQYSPDIMMGAVDPLAGAPKFIPKLAISEQRRALGLALPELKTAFGRGKSAEAARTLIEQGVTSKAGNPQTLFDKASELGNKVGQGIGDIRDSVGPQSIEPVLDSLEQFKADRTGGATGGKWNDIISKIDEAKETIKGLVRKGTIEAQPEKSIESGLVNQNGNPILKTIPAVQGYVPPISLGRIADAKKELGNIVNWFAQNVSQEDAKGISNAIEKSMEGIIQNAGGDIGTYKKLKPIYGAVKTAKQGLNREIGKQQGNMAVSLPALVLGASGDPSAIAKVGAFEIARRRGAGAAVPAIVNSPKLLAPLAAATSSALRPLQRSLSEEKALEFLIQAKGNPQKARELAARAGYSPTE